MRGGACRCGTVRRGRPPRRRSSVLATLGAVVLLALPSAAGSVVTPTAADRTAGSLAVVVHGQGRVTSDPAGAVDCPGVCTFSFTGSTTVKLRATPAGGYELASWGDFCDRTPDCTFTLGDFNRTLDVFFRPRAQLQLWPAGEGTIALTPPGTDRFGDPGEPCTQDNASDLAGCERYYLLDTTVTATASADPGSTFLGWSTPACAGTGPCELKLSREAASLVARFSPLEVRVIRGGNGTGRIVSEPAGIACPPTCEAPFATGSQVVLVAQPDPAFPFLSWKFGCTPTPADPRRCMLTATSHPNWVGVALGEDEELPVPTTVAVLFDVTRAGEGEVVGRELSCGARCEHRYAFGTEEDLRARPAAGWRFTRWSGICPAQPTCRLHVGPVTSLGATFTENLVPRLLSARASGRAGGRRLTVRLSVRHAAQARLRLRRDGGSRVLADRRYALVAGANAVMLPVPAAVKAGRYRLSIAVSDGQGGGRTYTRVLRIGP